jgi:hypothetical protein
MTEQAELSAAVVDLRLGKGDSVCQRLQRLGIPFVVHTGYSAEEVRQHYPNAPVIRNLHCTVPLLRAGTASAFLHSAFGKSRHSTGIR